MEIRSTSYQGFRFRYALEGKGLPLVFVGGAFQAIDRLGPLAEHWFHRYQTLLIELPGFGQSDFLPPDYGFSFTAQCIDAVIRETGLNAVIMVGTSYGSPSVFHYVATHPHTTQAMILGGSCRYIDRLMEYQIRWMLWVARSHRAGIFPNVFTEIMCNTQAATIPNARRIQQVLMRSLSRMDEQDREKFIANSQRLLSSKLDSLPIPVPTLVFTGEYDLFTRADRLQEFEESCEDLQVVRLSDADHMYHLEKTEETLGLIDQFIDERVRQFAQSA